MKLQTDYEIVRDCVLAALGGFALVLGIGYLLTALVP